MNLYNKKENPFWESYYERFGDAMSNIWACEQKALLKNKIDLLFKDKQKTMNANAECSYNGVINSIATEIEYIDRMISADPEGNHVVKDFPIASTLVAISHNLKKAEGEFYNNTSDDYKGVTNLLRKVAALCINAGLRYGMPERNWMDLDYLKHLDYLKQFHPPTSGSEKILIIGDGRHGKDTLAEFWRDEYALTFKSSSLAAAEIFIYDELKDSHGYNSFEDCYNDRHNHRSLWKYMICKYNEFDRARLAKEILKENEAYVGMRCPLEIEECIRQGLFDRIIWVDASARLPKEDRSSFGISIEMIRKLVANTTVKFAVLKNNKSKDEFVDISRGYGDTIFKGK